MPVDPAGKVHVRTPTYKRPDALRRCIESMQAQSWQNWVCDIYDDDPAGSAEEVVEAVADTRVHFNHNRPQRFASKNIDQCFSRDNPRDADFFCVVEDDNFILPDFMADNIRICRERGVDLVMRNQLIEYASGTPQARLSQFGIFDRMFREGVYQAERFRLSLIPGIGVSNGALFWTRSAKSRLEIGFACTATLQEYMRTFSIWEDIYVAIEPLAVWAENGDQTTRDLGGRAGYLRRELDLKRSIQRLQKEAWRLAGQGHRSAFLGDEGFSFDRRVKARGLLKALIAVHGTDVLGLRERMELAARGMLIRLAGALPQDFDAFIRSRVGG